MRKICLSCALLLFDFSLLICLRSDKNRSKNSEKIFFILHRTIRFVLPHFRMIKKTVNVHFPNRLEDFLSCLATRKLFYPFIFKSFYYNSVLSFIPLWFLLSYQKNFFVSPFYDFHYHKLLNFIAFLSFYYITTFRFAVSRGRDFFLRL